MGTLKKYKSKRVLSISEPVGDGRNAYIRFAEVAGGGAFFQTTDTTLQRAMQKSSKYGKLFTLDETKSVDYDLTEPSVSYSTTDLAGALENAEEAVESILDAESSATAAINTAKQGALDAIDEAIAGIDITYDVIN